ncbi:MAG TPA: ferredoxin family protein [Spirochaetota bacterium]|nr:ferredoxin family protein [Spirochaetota bacterium]HPI22535.1 ferredoxin family protein [Spirochaetota bacterium]HPU90326.1 ferredoxin family protein [Spirochaetota bacterium]
MGKKAHTVIVRSDLCKGCELCIHFCKRSVLRFSPEFNIQGYHFAEADPAAECNGCMVCTSVCPEVAIEVHYE